jgi:hypothetical protein
MTTYPLPKGTTSAETDEALIDHMRELFRGQRIKMSTIRYFLIADTATEVFELINLGLSRNDSRELYKPEESYVLERIGQKDGSDDWHVCFLKATSTERYEQDIRQGRVFFEAVAKAVEKKTGEPGRKRVVYDGSEVEARRPIATPPGAAMLQ